MENTSGKNAVQEQTNTLDILLQVEAKAASMVSDAEEEADRRVREAGEKAAKDYEDRIKNEIRNMEESFKEYQIKIREDYKNLLEEYRRELSAIKPDNEKFSALIIKYLDKG